MKEAIILAGGYGSRLGSTEDRPKPLEIVAGRPIAEWVLRQAVSKGIEHVVFAIGFGGMAVRQHFGTGVGFGCRIHYSESAPEGTGVAFLKAQELLEEEDPFLVLNGDTYTEYELGHVDTSRGGIGCFYGRGNPAGVWVFPEPVKWDAEMPKSLQDIIDVRPYQTARVRHGAFWDIGTPAGLRLARTELHLVLPMRFAEWQIMSLEMWVGKMRMHVAQQCGVIAEEIRVILGNGGKVMVCGNGGSMADAMHFATELQNGLVKGEDKGGNKVLVLGSESPYLSARVNDLETGSTTIFAKLVDTWAEKGDLLVCLSTSGESGNILQAAKVATDRGCLVAGFTREESSLAEVMNMGVAIPGAAGVQRIQEITMIALHCIAEQVEAGQ